MDIKAFKAIRPNEKFITKVAALPYDVYSSEEARVVVNENSYSFLGIDRAETLMPKEINVYDASVYKKANERYNELLKQNILIQDTKKAYYVYELTYKGQTQRGITALVKTKDYENNIIKKHENTRDDKLTDRVNHIKALSAHTGPIFMMHKKNNVIKKTISEAINNANLIFDFYALNDNEVLDVKDIKETSVLKEEAVRHKGYMISNECDINKIEEAFKETKELYIADGHHRAEAAYRVSKDNNNEKSKSFLAVVFPEDELKILDYNRYVKDLNGLSKDEFISKISKEFEIEQLNNAKKPCKKATYSMYIDGKWYSLKYKKYDELTNIKDKLDVSILQNNLLEPILGIENPKTNNRIKFIGGIRGLVELERLVNENEGVAFALLATSIKELMNISDKGLLMPPKSTWFEPKLRSGLFINDISN